MAIKRDYIIIGVVVILSVAVTIIITSIFKGSRSKPDEKLYEQLMQAYQSQIDDLKDHLKVEATFRAEQKQTYENAMQADSLLTIAFINNQAKYAPINKRLNEIPAYIKSIGRNGDSIRNAFKSPN